MSIYAVLFTAIAKYRKVFELYFELRYFNPILTSEETVTSNISDEIMSVSSSVEDLRFGNEELPLLGEESAETGFVKLEPLSCIALPSTQL